MLYALKMLPLHGALGVPSECDLRMCLACIGCTDCARVPLEWSSHYSRSTASHDCFMRRSGDAGDYLWTDTLTDKIVDGCYAMRCCAQSFGIESESMNEAATSKTKPRITRRLDDKGPQCYNSRSVKMVTDMIVIDESYSGGVASTAGALGFSLGMNYGENSPARLERMVNDKGDPAASVPHVTKFSMVTETSVTLLIFLYAL